MSETRGLSHARHIRLVLPQVLPVGHMQGKSRKTGTCLLGLTTCLTSSKLSFSRMSMCQKTYKEIRRGSCHFAGILTVYT